MITAQHILTMFDYHYWTTAEVIKAANSLSDEAYYAANPYSVGGIHAQLSHLLWAEQLWLARFTGREGTPFTPDLHPTKAVLAEQWASQQTAMRAYLSELSEETLAADLVYQRQGQRNALPLWVALYHVVNHTTDHRAQILYQIYQAGGQTVAQDVVHYWRTVKV
jgi:uncharacterized damage-inducible protein DinB